MQGCLFGDSDKPLFAVMHPPSAGARRDCGVLVCPPIGHEAIRAHRAVRQLSRQLSRQGFYVMRFDYTGEGDSWGEAQDGDLAQWKTDVGLACTELCDVSGSERVIVIGVRVGATLALLADYGRADVASLILWDPIVSGREFVDSLRGLHRDMLVDRMRYTRPRQSPADEMLGFVWPETRAKEMETVDLARLQRSPCERVAILSSEDPSSFAGVCDRLGELGAKAQLVTVFDDTRWSELPEIENLIGVGPMVNAVVEQALEEDR